MGEQAIQDLIDCIRSRRQSYGLIESKNIGENCGLVRNSPEVNFIFKLNEFITPRWSMKMPRLPMANSLYGGMHQKYNDFEISPKSQFKMFRCLGAPKITQNEKGGIEMEFNEEQVSEISYDDLSVESDVINDVRVIEL